MLVCVGIGVLEACNLSGCSHESRIGGGKHWQQLLALLEALSYSVFAEVMVVYAKVRLCECIYYIS